MDKDADDIPTFCHRNNLSRSALYNAWKAGRGPRIMRIGRKVLITREAAEQWRRQCEQASAQPEAASAA
jgi:predicted DNA-binding transcriptional regulator AlpA